MAARSGPFPSLSVVLQLALQKRGGQDSRDLHAGHHHALTRISTSARAIEMATPVGELSHLTADSGGSVTLLDACLLADGTSISRE